MILIDDRRRTVIEPLATHRGELLYDFDLMQGGGHLRGWLVPESEHARISDALDALADPAAFREKYRTDKDVLLFAVGDGNHSLATAKTCYENLKKTDPDACHSPARYALAELVNLHDDSLQFEPIHRICTGCTKASFLHEMKTYFEQKPAVGTQTFTLVSASDETLTVPANHALCVGTVQMFLDTLAAKKADFRIDYIHGEEEVRRAAREGWLGMLLPPTDKNDLFRSVIEEGALPRKTFSMGEADEKRFYLEARALERG